VNSGRDAAECSLGFSFRLASDELVGQDCLDRPRHTRLRSRICPMVPTEGVPAWQMRQGERRLTCSVRGLLRCPVTNSLFVSGRAMPRTRRVLPRRDRVPHLRRSSSSFELAGSRTRWRCLLDARSCLSWECSVYCENGKHIEPKNFCWPSLRKGGWLGAYPFRSEDGYAVFICPSGLAPSHLIGCLRTSPGRRGIADRVRLRCPAFVW